MNIGIIMHSYLPNIGGAQISAHCLAHSLVKLGHNVVVFSENSLVKACKEKDWHFSYDHEGVFRIPGKIQNQLIRFVPELWTKIMAAMICPKIKKFNLDVIQIVFAWPWLPVTLEIKKKTGLPVVIRCAGDDIQVNSSVNYGIRKDTNKTKAMKRGFNEIDRAIAISKTVSEEYMNIGVKEEKIVEIPPGVDWHEFQNYGTPVNVIRKKWGIPLDKKVIISVGRNHPKKGFKDLIDALPILNAKKDEFVVVIVGKETDQLIPNSQAKGVADQFYPINEVSSVEKGQLGSFPSIELIELYKASDYFVLPSYIETYANVALEAMAAGIPAIVTDAPGCIDTVIDKYDGLIIPVNSPEIIADKIWQLKNDTNLEKNIIKHGYLKAELQDWDHIAEKYLEVYEKLIHL